eukprot:TRINITY_DN1886_c0_g1_i3.p1 TRINITY_DN1886_c0_g1~~TRINITY_DN1886_c0_g1_i3.p1  ORF type:complete len:311 (+),score=59.05 TRINITY_DN1886_c0_g1_i3:3-935(+)
MAETAPIDDGLTDEEREELLEEAEETYQEGLQFLREVDEIIERRKRNPIAGIGKFRRRIHAECQFIQRILNREIPTKSHQIRCTNMPFFETLVDVLKHETDVVAVSHVFHGDTLPNGKKEKIEIDVISRGGGCWTKVKSMRPEAIRAAWLGQTHGTRSIEIPATKIKQCAQNHPFHYDLPILVFAFSQGVTTDVAEYLEGEGYVVRGVRCDETGSALSNQPHVTLSEPAVLPEAALMEQNPNNEVFLDVTTLLAYVSDVVNGNHEEHFIDVVVESQAREEREKRTLPMLEGFMKGKKLLINQTTLARCTP